MADSPRMTLGRKAVLEYFINNYNLKTWVDRDTVAEEVFPDNIPTSVYKILDGLVEWGLLKEKTPYGERYYRLTRAGRLWYMRKMAGEE